jgi:hypothetical protein
LGEHRHGEWRRIRADVEHPLANQSRSRNREVVVAVPRSYAMRWYARYVRVPRNLAPAGKPNRRTVWPEALIYSGVILLFAALAGALMTPPLRLLIVGTALLAVAVCMTVARRMGRLQ